MFWGHPDSLVFLLIDSRSIYDLPKRNQLAGNQYEKGRLPTS